MLKRWIINRHRGQSWFSRNLLFGNARVFVMGMLCSAALFSMMSRTTLRDGKSEIKKSDKVYNTTEIKEQTQPLSKKKYSVLPDKIFTVVGLESTGTTFMTTLLRDALGLDISLDVELVESMGEGYTAKHTREQNNVENDKYYAEIQHVSLPWGVDCIHSPNASQQIIPVVYPGICGCAARERHYLSLQGRNRISLPDSNFLATKSVTIRDFFQKINIQDQAQQIKMLEECFIMMDAEYTSKQGNDPDDSHLMTNYFYYPKRYILNITSHLDWYIRNGVDIKVIVMIRDETIATRARFEKTCHNQTILQREGKVGKQFIQEAIQKYAMPSLLLENGAEDSKVIVVSYEMLVNLQNVYLKSLYHKLGIDSDYFPEIIDGNAKHVLPMK